METYQKEFIEFLIDNNALRFGTFTLKSGRTSPYFINTGQFFSGESVYRLASFYSQSIIKNNQENISIIYGPAYKGIPLAVSISIYFASNNNKHISYLFDRKEAKIHGEFSDNYSHKSRFLGKIPTIKDKVVIVDDVLTTGGTKYEAVNLLHKLQPEIAIKGLFISVNRQEIDSTGQDPIHNFYHKTGITVFSIITLDDIIEYLNNNSKNSENLDNLLEYKQKWGIKI